MGAQLRVEAPGDPRALIEQIVDMVGVRISAQREAHHREGYELFTVDAVITTAHRHPERIIEPQMRQRCPLTRERCARPAKKERVGHRGTSNL